jgi:hypothetical protein
MERLRQYFEICRIRPEAQRPVPVFDIVRAQARRTGDYEPLVLRAPPRNARRPAVVVGSAERSPAPQALCEVLSYE